MKRLEKENIETMTINEMNPELKKEVSEHYRKEFDYFIRALQEAFGSAIKADDQLAVIFLVDIIKGVIFHTANLMELEDDTGGAFKSWSWH